MADFLVGITWQAATEHLVPPPSTPHCAVVAAAPGSSLSAVKQSSCKRGVAVAESGDSYANKARRVNFELARSKLAATRLSAAKAHAKDDATRCLNQIQSATTMSAVSNLKLAKENGVLSIQALISSRVGLVV